MNPKNNQPNSTVNTACHSHFWGRHYAVSFFEITAIPFKYMVRLVIAQDIGHAHGMVRARE